MPKWFRLGQNPVLIVGCRPNLSQPLDIVIDALHRILVNEPGGANGRPIGGQRQNPEMDDVVRQEVIPVVRNPEHADRARAPDR